MYVFSRKQSRVNVTRRSFVMYVAPKNLLVRHDISSTTAMFSSLAQMRCPVLGPVIPTPINSMLDISCKLDISHNISTFQSKLHHKGSWSFDTPNFLLVICSVTMGHCPRMPLHGYESGWKVISVEQHNFLKRRVWTSCAHYSKIPVWMSVWEENTRKVLVIAASSLQLISLFISTWQLIENAFTQRL